MQVTEKTIGEPRDVLFRIKRGLAAYVSYLAACEMNPAFSEYVLYEPLLRILTARGYKVECEVECPGIQHAAVGDRKRLDFVAEGHALQLAIEVKWVKSSTPKISGDMEKLTAFQNAHPSAHCLLCLFGRHSFLGSLSVPAELRERGSAVYADLRLTKYGCRIFQLAQSPTNR
jgi:hypothetical protein